jgi:phosphatidylglycerol---prolipoprotein diacylglyceryl transferase
MLALPFPMIDPVAIAIGPFAVRWYALAYIAGIVLGWWLARRHLALRPAIGTREHADDFVTWVTLGIILGGRLGYVLFYRPGHYLFHPWEIAFVWQGGMAFHGGVLGVIVATLWFCRRNALDPFAFGDRVVPVIPIGLLLGRLANFINGELWGRASDAPWAMVFPTGGPEPRHPSQLYQAFLEGAVLFALLQWAVRQERFRARPGFVTGLFLLGYGVARIIGEFFRQPDAHLGFLLGAVTMGQLLSVPMIVAGVWMMRRATPR